MKSFEESNRALFKNFHHVLCNSTNTMHGHGEKISPVVNWKAIKVVKAFNPIAVVKFRINSSENDKLKVLNVQVKFP